MDLTILSKSESQLCLVVERLSGHNRSRTYDVQDATLRRKVVQKLHGFEHDVNC
jgi:hypothetical protein